MTTYYSKQYVNDTTISNEIKLKVESYPSNFTDNITDVQQLVARFVKEDETPVSVKENSVYLVKLSIPQDLNYKLNYAVRLVNILNESDDLRQQTSFQFVKYITIPARNLNAVEESEVWLYRIGNSDIVNAAVAIKIQNEQDFTVTTIQKQFSSEERATKIFYWEKDNEIQSIWKCDSEGNFDVDDDSKIIDYVNDIQKNNNLMAHIFEDESTGDNIICYFIFSPNLSNEYDAIYFYLRPIPQDDDIQWKDDNNNIMYGRHVDVSKVECSLFELTNILGIGNGTANINMGQNDVVNIGVWGRSEQIMAINGEEIRIGPSGYFELKDFPIKTLCVANTAPDDKYIVDIQYKAKESE